MNIFRNDAAQRAVEARFNETESTRVAALSKIKAKGAGCDFRHLDSLERYLNRFLLLGRADAATELANAASSGTEFTALERILEENNLMGVAFLRQGVRTARAICRVVIRAADGRVRGFGTGFMISPELMMTNNHVLESSESAASSTAQFGFLRDAAGRLQVPQEHSLAPGRFFVTDSDLDFSIVAVNPVARLGGQLAGRGWLPLIRESGKATVGEPLNIIQHPSGRPMEVAVRENKLSNVAGSFLHYLTDTMRGSSGSPVMNDQWKLVALHHAGVPERDPGGQILKRDGTPFQRFIDDPEEISWIANEGVRISAIVAELDRRSLTVERRMRLREAFRNPPIVALESDLTPPEPGADRVSGEDGAQGAVAIGPDGIARWRLNLTFGPFGSGDPQASLTIGDAGTAAAASSGMPLPAVVSADEPVPSTAEPSEYYHAEADANEAAAYYAAIDEDGSGDALYQGLRALLSSSHTRELSYRAARHDHLYPLIDRHPDGKLKSIYSGEVVSEEAIRAEIAMFNATAAEFAAERGLESTELSEAMLEAIDLKLESQGPFNCEHIVPQSWFQKRQPMKADMHHLFACEPGCNSFRSNIPYFDFSPADERRLRGLEVDMAEALLDDTLEAARSSCGIREGRKFEPDSGKGTAARATLYFVLRYPGEVGDVKSGAKLELTKSRLKILLKWAADEPPTIYERHRNAEIARIQGNRNPLIDRSEWLKKINFKIGFG